MQVKLVQVVTNTRRNPFMMVIQIASAACLHQHCTYLGEVVDSPPSLDVVPPLPFIACSARIPAGTAAGLRDDSRPVMVCWDLQ
jgi:hypothetical protein